MRKHNVPMDELPDRLNRFTRNPRICALALTMLPQLAGVKDLSVKRLLVEYWRSRVRKRGDLVGHSDRDFRNPNATIVITSRPTPIQDKAFKLLDLSPNCSQ